MTSELLPDLDHKEDVPSLELSSYDLATEAMELMSQTGFDVSDLPKVIEKLNNLATQPNCPGYIKELALEMQQMLKADDSTEETN